MHKILQYAGMALIGIAVLALIAIFASAKDGSASPMLLLSICVPLLVSGAMFYCFGAMVEHLIAIRRLNEKQLAVFEAIRAKT